MITGIYLSKSDGCHYRVSKSVYLNNTSVYYLERLNGLVPPTGINLLCHKEFTGWISYGLFTKVEKSDFKEIPAKMFSVVKPDNITKFVRDASLNEIKKLKKGKPLRVTKTKITKPKKK